MSSRDQDDLLRLVTLGEIARDDARLRELAARDPEFARELAATLSVVDALERDGVIAEARAARSAGNVAREPTRAPSAQRRWPWLVAGLAAAAVLLILFRPSRENGPGPDDIELGTGVHCVSPREGVATGYSVFRWTLGDTGVVTKIQIEDSSGNKLGDPYIVRDASEWRPDPNISATWPDTIVWRIEVSDGENSLVGAHDAKASRK